MNFYAISALINAITSITLGFFVLSKNPRGKTNIGFALFTLSAFCWSLPYYFWQISTTAYSALFWSKALMAGAIFIPITYLHFVFALLGILNKRKKFLILSYIIFFIFLILDFTPYFISHVEPLLNFKYWPIAGPIFSLFLVVWFFYVLYSTYLLFKRYRESSGIIKLQIKYVIIGMIIGFAGGSTNYFLWYRIPIPPFTNILASVYVGTVAYAILRYRLMDIRIIARKIFIYLGVAAFAYISYSILIIAYTNFFGSVYNLKTLIAGIFMAPVFVFGFYATDKLLTKFANKYLFYSLYSYEKTINKLSQELNYETDLDKIIDSIVNTIKHIMQLDRAGVLLINLKTKPIYYQIAKVIGFNRQNGISLVQDNFLTKHLQKTQKPLVRDELDLLTRDTESIKDQKSFEHLRDNMVRIEASLCLPLMSSNQLIGIIVLGAKISGDAYTKEDLELLNTLSLQAGIAIDNARLYKEVQDFNKTLKQKVDEQTKDIKEKSQHLQELLNMKSDFLRVVNHQLNTPLSVLNGAFSMTKEKSITPEQGMKIASAGLSRINRTVSDFWDAYELEGERMKMEPEKIDISTVVDKLLLEKKKLKLAQERNLKFLVKKLNFKMPLVWCDAKKIEHVISNLLDNAVFYTPKGSITVFYELIGKDFLKINIQDTGAGISAEDKKRLFQKFSRGTGASSLHPDGSGLGLYIAKKIIEGNDGKMTFTSKGLGKGSTFSFTLPIYKNQKVSLAAQEEKNLGARKKITIFEKNL